jgi:hypothetical protein
MVNKVLLQSINILELIKTVAKWNFAIKEFAIYATTLFTRENLAKKKMNVITISVLELNAQLLFVMKYPGSKLPKTPKTSELGIKSLLLVVKLLL